MNDWTNDWADGSVTIEQLDALALEVARCRAEEEATKKVYSEAYAKCERAENDLVEALTKAGKNKYHIEGVGTASLVTKTMVSVPKNANDKRLLFDYIESKYGPDFLMDKLSIHSASLNSFANQEFENAEDKALFRIPGLAEPKATISLRIRKETV